MRYELRAAAFLLAALTLCAPRLVMAQDFAIEPPGEREFVQDLARMVTAEDVVAIREIGDQLLTDTAIPIIVVTIDSMSQYGGGGSWRIETFARVLFDQWGIGYEEIDGQSWNRGILLLVSKNDRKARIELGADWAGEFDATCREIMDGQIVANFKQGNFSGGILAGVQALDMMSRGIEIPRPLKPPWFWPATIGLVFLAVFTGVSLYRSGASGWAWLLWAAIFGILGFILINSLRASARSGSGGGFGGGSFGGGFGGGGGATGSW
jgi:uncharacterized protein